MIATDLPTLRATSRTSVARSMWSCAVPCEKLSRTTSTPARIIRSSTSANSTPDRGWRRSWWRGALAVSPWRQITAGGRCRRSLALSRAIIGRRAAASVTDRLRRRGAPLQDLEGRQRLALEHLEKGAAAGRDVADVASRCRSVAIAASVSPPPAMLKARLCAIARAIVSVPSAKASNSKTPTGPFQTIVPADFSCSASAAAVCGPMSRIRSSVRHRPPP